MIGVIVPAHDEARSIGRCLRSIARAASDPLLDGEPVLVVVAADACTDATVRIARRHACDVVELDARCVGKARSLAADVAIARGARWLGSTDADSVVPPHWLSVQLSYRHAAVCGTVRLLRASFLTKPVLARYRERYCFRDGHTHVHGANLGISTHAYLSCGGFPHIPTHEDVGLVTALKNAGIAIAWRANPCVHTSARLDGRAPEGLSAYLAALRGPATMELATQA